MGEMWTAAELRKLGIPVADDIPPNAVVPKSAVTFELVDSMTWDEGTNVVEGTLYFKITEPFEWEDSDD